MAALTKRPLTPARWHAVLPRLDDSSDSIRNTTHECMSPDIDLTRSIRQAYRARGWDFFKDGNARLQTVDLDDSGGVHLTGSVEEPGGARYKQDVHLVPDASGATSVSGTCTCRTMVNCGHVAALIYAWDSRQQPDSGATAFESAGEPDDDELSPALTRLLDLAGAAAERGKDTDPQGRQLRYVLSLEQQKGGLMPVVRPLVVGFDDAGQVQGEPRPYPARNVWNTPRAAFLNADDIALLQDLTGAQPASLNAETTVELSGPFAGSWLERIVATGRAHWQELSDKRLRRAPARDGHAAWLGDAHGGQHFTVLPEAPEAVLLPLEPPYAVDPQAGTLAPVTCDLSDALAATLLAGPSIPAGEARAFRAEAEQRLGDSLPVLPAAPERKETRSVTPTPVLRLFAARIDPIPSPRGWRAPPPDGPVDAAIAAITFDYGGVRVDEGDPAATLEWIEEGTLVRVPRAETIEKSAARKLAQCGLEEVRPTGRTGNKKAARGPTWRGLLRGHLADDRDRWLQFRHRTVPELQEAGWRVEVRGDFPYEVAPAPSEWQLEVEESDALDWFGVVLGVDVDGMRVDLLPILNTILEQLPASDRPDEQRQEEQPPATVFVPLPDGRHLPLPAERIAPIARTLRDLYAASEAVGEAGEPRVRAERLGELTALEDAAAAASLKLEGGRRLRALAEALRAGGGLEPAKVPGGLDDTLRQYQVDGLSWLQTLGQHGFGGILADDMGLGKTIQALAHLLAEKAAGRLDRPCLLVAPTSLVWNWINEARRFAPDLQTLVLHGPDRRAYFDAIEEADLVVTTYALLPRDKTELLARGYHVVLCDEAQNVKNADAQAAKVLRQLDARQVICLTGTPMENHLDELWSLLKIAVPGVFGERTEFRKEFRTPIEKHGNQDKRRVLSRRVRPFLLRRTKAQVASELPPRTDMVEPVELTGDQRDLYETVRLQMDARVRQQIREKGLAQSQITVLDALLKLRQVCCDPRLVKLEAARGTVNTAKLDRLLDMLTDLLDEGRQVLVFSQFTSMLALIAESLKEAGMGYVLLTGDTKDRRTPVERFQNGEAPIFLISLKAGGTGLNLTAADTVIHYDPWWNPAVEAQASDRAHRIGQDKPVFVYKMIAEGTVEERIVEMQARKRDLASVVQDAESGEGAALTYDDVEHLLAPLK